MTEILLSTPLKQDLNLQKIGRTLFWHENTNTFYKLTFLPQSGIFHNEDVIQPKVASLTPYNPYFLAINYLRPEKISHSSLPKYLRQIDLLKIANIEESEGEKFYVRNEQKIYDFLETRVAKLHVCFEQNFESHYIKTEQTEKRYITPEIITVLKSQIQHAKLVDEFAKERYDYMAPKKKVFEEQEKNNEKGKKKKPTTNDSKKNKEPRLEKGQQTLFSMAKTKKSETIEIKQ